MRWLRGWAFLAAAAAVVLLLAGAASTAEARQGGRQAEPDLTTQYVARLRAVSLQVGASLTEISALPAVTAANRPTLLAAGKRLAASAAAARDVLRTYRDARTRYGTSEEWRLAQKLLTDLQAARATYGQRAGVVLPTPSTKQRSQARTFFETALVTAANQQIARWTNDQGLADALTAGGIATVRVQLRNELTTRLRRQAERAITNATGFAIALNVPLKQQVVFQAQRLASNWLATAVLRVSPQGLVIQLAGGPIVRWIGATLQAALRNAGNATGRATRTMEQFATWRRELALLSPTSSLQSARALSANVDRELNRTGFLKHDLRRARRLAVLAELEQAESLTRTALGLFRSRFLLDTPMARADLNAMVDQAKRLHGEIEAINRKLMEPLPLLNLTGTWRCNWGGIYEIKQSGTGVTWIGRSAASPDPKGKFSWYHEFRGTIRDGRFVVGTFADVPAKSYALNSGPLVVEIVGPKELRKVARYGGVTTFPGFGSSVWTR